ncbi:MAG: T9SS type A sorting domain-containing protein [Saprospiraceae bacterium]|nr:T9SS type A sorting domain-containing protein [Saprospiraceae bacterium]
MTINTEIQEVVNIRIFNVNGQVVYQNTQRIDNQTEINLSDLAAGNYFLMIANDATQNTIYSTSFVKE